MFKNVENKRWIPLMALVGWVLLNPSPCLGASENSPVAGQSIQATPYDARMDKAGMLEDHLPSEGARSAEELFLQARSFRYQADSQGDYWQTPEETEALWSGDCEDKALWLYAQLKMNGHKGVRLVVGRKSGVSNGFHVWVTLQDDNGSVFVLDPTAQKRIWHFSDFPPDYYRPLFSFDGSNRYRHNS